MNLLCPACHTPLPSSGDPVVTCATCAAEVDLARAGTIAGRPRFVPEIDRSGREVGGYRIGARIGGGGMGTVYRASDESGRQAAVKFLSAALASEADTVARFAREVELLAALAHPGIVRVLAHGSDDGIPWFAMELVDGVDLRARLAGGPLPPAETASIFAPLLGALAHAHARGVVHRDLKPANVLLAADGARLADFGIARFEASGLARSAATRLTETAAVIGTLPYMSPEQRRGGTVDRRSDLFAVGVMLYEVATGALPQGAFPPPSELNRAYGRAFDRLVMVLLQSDPTRRPPSAEAAASALERALATGRARLRSLSAAVVLAIVGVSLGGRAWFAHHPAEGPSSARAAASTAPSLPAPLPPSPATPPGAPASPGVAAPPSDSTAAIGSLGTITKSGSPARMGKPKPIPPETKAALRKLGRKLTREMSKKSKAPGPKLKSLADDGFAPADPELPSKTDTIAPIPERK